MSYTQIGNVKWSRDDLISELSNFLEIYNKRPKITDNNYGGMNSSHLFPTWFFCKQFNPKYIIESGVWKGLGTWFLEQTCPDAKIISIDPDLELREFISPNVEYTTEDFSLKNWDDLIPKKDRENTLCFFDDHQGIGRIKQSSNLGFKHILYEDNYPDFRGSYKSTQLINGEQALHVKSGENMSPKSALVINNKVGSYEWLIENIETYYEFPPIYSGVDSARGFGWAKITREKYINITPEPLLVTHKNKFDVFYKDRSGYTWICYIKLKNN